MVNFPSAVECAARSGLRLVQLPRNSKHRFALDTRFGRIKAFKLKELLPYIMRKNSDVEENTLLLMNNKV